MVGRITTKTRLQTIDDALLRGTALLSATSSSPRLDAEVLLAHTLNVTRTQLLAHGDRKMADNLVAMFLEHLQRRMSHEPVAYIVGEKEFYGRPFHVDSNVLIPRPDTELIVDRVLDYVSTRRRVPARIADVGTGSGCLGITLALELPSPFVEATDVSEGALNVAEQNAKKHGVSDLVDCKRSFLLSDRKKPLDLIVANLPYVTEAEYHTTDADVREFEPKCALVPSEEDSSGVSLYVALLDQLPEILRPGGAAFFEAHPDQMSDLFSAVQAVFPGARISVSKDLAGKDRVLSFVV